MAWGRPGMMGVVAQPDRMSWGVTEEASWVWGGRHRAGLELWRWVALEHHLVYPSTEGRHWEYSDDGGKRWQIAGCILGQRQGVLSCWPAPNTGLPSQPNADQLPRRKTQVCRKGAFRRPGKWEKAKHLIGLQETEEGKTWPWEQEKSGLFSF